MPSALGTNNANFYDPKNGFSLTQSTNYSSSQNYLTDVGAYINSPGPYSTFDQGGDVFQWNDLNPDVVSSSRGLRGGVGTTTPTPGLVVPLPLAIRPGENYNIGFRVASSEAAPEPGSLALLLAGAVAFGIWRRRNA